MHWLFFLIRCVSFSEPWKDTGNQSGAQNDGEEVRAPLPVIRETLYDDAMLYGYVFLFLMLVFRGNSEILFSRDACTFGVFVIIYHTCWCRCNSLGLNNGITRTQLQ